MAIVPHRRGQEGLSRREWDPMELMQEMLRWDPFHQMTQLAGPSPSTFIPTFEVKETKDAYVFKADLPGVKENDLDVSLADNRIVISGKRSEERREEGERYYAYERSYGSFSRAFTLPEGIDAENVNAELKEGVLTVSVPKKPESQPRRIALKGGASAGKDQAKA